VYKRGLVIALALGLLLVMGTGVSAQTGISNWLTTWNPNVTLTPLILIDYAAPPLDTVGQGGVVPVSLNITPQLGFPPGGYPDAVLIVRILENGLPVEPTSIAFVSGYTWTWDASYQWWYTPIPVPDSDPQTVNFGVQFLRIGGFSVSMGLQDCAN